MALITCQNLTLGYEGKPIVKNLAFSIREGNYFCIVGENGSGKSTLMRTLLGLQQPLSGKIEFGDGLKQDEIGYLPQQTLVQRDFPASVREIVLSGCQGHCGIRPFYGKKEKEMAQAAMEKMNIASLAGRCYRELSGGQQQRVLLARALCAAQKVILLDEPVSGLDPKVTAEMYRLIEELNRKDGITVIMISHDMTAALTYATHILHVGQSWFCGTKEEYLQSEVGRMYASFYADNISVVSEGGLTGEKSGGKNSSGRGNAAGKDPAAKGTVTEKSAGGDSGGRKNSGKSSSARRRK